MWAGETRRNPIRNGKRTRPSDAMRPGNATRGLLRSSHHIREQLSLSNRRLLPCKRCQTMGNNEPPHRGILPIHQDQGNCHIHRARTEKKLLHGRRVGQKYAALNYMQRLEIIEDSAGKTEGVLVEWEEFRIADSCDQALLKIQTLTDGIQKLLDGKIECRHNCPDHGREKNLELSPRDEIRKTTHQYRNVSMPKKIMPIAGSNTHPKNRTNTSQMARTK